MIDTKISEHNPLRGALIVMSYVLSRSAATTAPSIFVVDDEGFIRFAVADFLRDCGYQVIEAADADETVAVLEMAAEPIDLVFSDVQMPGAVDGRDCATP